MTLESLRQFGANVEEGLDRCMKNEAFYFRLIKMALEDRSFEALGEALSADDLGKAFEEAHKLKGVTGNLSLSPIYEPLCKLTELLRHKTAGDYAALYSEIMAKKSQLQSLID